MFSIHGELFLAWKKVQIVRITPSSVPFTWKKFSAVKFPIPPNLGVILSHSLPPFAKPWYIKLYDPFLCMGCNCLKAMQSHYEEAVYFLPEIIGTH